VYVHHHQPINICWGTGLLYGLHIRRTGHNPPRGPKTDWWVLTTSTAAGTNGLTWLLKLGETRENKFLVTQPMTDQRCLTSAIARRSALTAGLSSSSSYVYMNHFFCTPNAMAQQFTYSQSCSGCC
jgi:hypothetical protein